MPNFFWDDGALPRATLERMVKEIIGTDAIMPQDALETLNKCGVKFITMLTSEANEIAEHEGKTSVGEEHFMEALKKLGFESYLEKVKEAAQDHHEQEKETRDRKKNNKLAHAALINEDFQNEQEELFEASRARVEGLEGLDA